MLDYLQIMTLLGSSVIEWEMIRRSHEYLKGRVSLSKPYPIFFRVFLVLCPIALIAWTIMWTFQTGLMQYIGLSLIGITFIGLVFKKFLKNIHYHTVYLRIDSSICLVIYLIALIFKLRKVF